MSEVSEVGEVGEVRAPGAASRDGRPLAAVQLDLDGQDARAAHYGLPAPSGGDGLYAALPRFLDIFAAHGVRATLFVIGRDVADEGKRRLLERAAAMGHEIANHTHTHPPAFLRLAPAAREAEIRAAQEALEKRLGTRPAGFRAPNFELDEGLAMLLERLGFAYDASLVGTPAGPALRAVKALATARAGAPFARGGYLGRPAFGLAPRRPYRPSPRAVWRAAAGRRGATGLVEVPVTVSPLLRMPCHASFALALPAGAARPLTAWTLKFTAARGLPLVYVFHLSDLGEAAALGGVEGRLYGGLDRRLAFVDWACGMIDRHFASVTTVELSATVGGPGANGGAGTAAGGGEVA